MGGGGEGLGPVLLGVQGGMGPSLRMWPAVFQL